SLSWSYKYAGGQQFEAADDLSENPIYTTPPGHAGVTFVVSTGDEGAHGWYPAYAPSVVAVGGTSLTLVGGNYGSETGWSGSGGGVSNQQPRPPYQQGIVTADGNVTLNTTHRSIPDVAFDADLASSVMIYDSYDPSGATPWG